MAKGIVAAERKSDIQPQTMVHRIARNWPLLGTRRGVENELVTAVCNVGLNQTAVISGDNASSKTFLELLQFYKSNRINDYVVLQPITDLHAKIKKR